MTSNNICECLYQTLGTTRELFNKESAIKNYKELIGKIQTLPEGIKIEVQSLLDQAKKTLGNHNTERHYHYNGSFDGEHSCEGTVDTLKTILSLYKEAHIPITDRSYTISATTDNDTQDSSDIEQGASSNIDTDVTVEIIEITDHRFRNGKLKFTILIQPGKVKISEDESHILKLAKQQLKKYVNTLRNDKPRRLTHLVRMRPYLLKLINND